MVVRYGWMLLVQRTITVCMSWFSRDVHYHFISTIVPQKTITIYMYQIYHEGVGGWLSELMRTPACSAHVPPRGTVGRRHADKREGLLVVLTAPGDR